MLLFGATVLALLDVNGTSPAEAILGRELVTGPTAVSRTPPRGACTCAHYAQRGKTAAGVAVNYQGKHRRRCFVGDHLVLAKASLDFEQPDLAIVWSASAS